MICCSRHLIAALACAAVCHGAHADRSRLGDDGDAIEAGDCEVELAFERQSTRGSSPRQRERSLQLGCGIGWGTELTAALARQRGGGERSDTVALEAKTSLGDRRPGGIGWALEFGLAAERADAGRWRRSETFVAIDATVAPAPDWVIEAKLGALRDHQDRKLRRLWTLALEHELTDTLEARVELDAEGRERPLLGVELRYEFWPDRARIGLALAGRGGAARERRVGVGVTFEF